MGPFDSLREVIAGQQAGQAYEKQLASQLATTSLRFNYENELQRAEANVARLKSLITLLDRNPDFQQMVELMQNRY